MKPFLKLTRLYLSLAIAFSTLAGFVFYSHTLNLTAFYAFMGVLLLSAAASAINQYQERHLDILMNRTQSRPLPSKQMQPVTVIAISVIMGIAGLLFLYFGTTPITAALGLFNMLWYNAVYTPLKRSTTFVVLIGALTGAIPPMMGWTAAGGDVFSLNILLVAFFMFLWQIPHFFLLILKFSKDYEAAGIPTLLSAMTEKQLKTIIFVWILGTSCSTLVFPVFHVISGFYITIALLLLNALLIFYFYRIVFNKPLLFRFGLAFRSLYLYQIIILLMLIIEAIK